MTTHPIHTTDDTNEVDFWAPYQLREGETGKFTIGPLTLWVERGEGQWLIASSYRSEQLDELPRALCPGAEKDWPADTVSRRLMDHRPAGHLELRPAMADRLLVAFAEEELHVMPGAGALVYISSPLWLQLWVGDKLLFERPVVQPSDTWFGPSTRFGELAYGVRTPVTTTPEGQIQLPHRAISRVEVKNRADDDLVLRRMVLPAPNLGLYFDRKRPELGLWTEGVRLERRRESESTDMKILDGSADWLTEANRAASPRQPQTRNLLVRALSSIIS